jgi:hypothetical protein
MPEPYQLGEHIIASSSKLIVIDKLLSEILPNGERVLIFSVRRLQPALWAFFANAILSQQWTGCDNISLASIAPTDFVPVECLTCWRTSLPSAQFHMQD